MNPLAPVLVFVLGLVLGGLTLMRWMVNLALRRSLVITCAVPHGDVLHIAWTMGGVPQEPLHAKLADGALEDLARDVVVHLKEAGWTLTPPAPPATESSDEKGAA